MPSVTSQIGRLISDQQKQIHRIVDQLGSLDPDSLTYQELDKYLGKQVLARDLLLDLVSTLLEEED